MLEWVGEGAVVRSVDVVSIKPLLAHSDGEHHLCVGHNPLCPERVIPIAFNQEALQAYLHKIVDDGGEVVGAPCAGVESPVAAGILCHRTE